MAVVDTSGQMQPLDRLNLLQGELKITGEVGLFSAP